ncbi:MAG: NAD(P)H-dependent oxidoreductase [Candidatus Cloacimonetes bacterium]|nr:NAD(P)H-dependent oxidoreductase [Candidatus Cloacimonadota bacterium]
MKKILVIKAHPREDSFCNALTYKYITGAKRSGNEIKAIDLRKLDLEGFLKNGHNPSPELTSDLQNAQELISWADHLTFTYPTWWATPPAILKLFIERIWEPGFAFKYLESKGSIPKWDKLLTGRTTRVLSTMDSPPFYMNLIVGDPGGKMMKDIITFTGMKFVGKHYFGSVRTSSKKQRKQWLEKAYKVGTKE